MVKCAASVSVVLRQCGVQNQNVLFILQNTKKSFPLRVQNVEAVEVCCEPSAAVKNLC